MSHSDHHIAHLHRAIAQELREVGGLIGQVADVLVADERFAQSHIGQLQAFDHIIQRAHESAALLERLAQGSAPLDAIGDVRLTAVQDRFRASLSAAA